jgi:hypothetical protein
MSDRPSLRNLQQGFRDLLTKDELRISTEFQAPPVGSVDDRLWIYQDGLKQIVFDSVKDDFNLTAKLLGEKRFAVLAEKFAGQCPAKTWSLAEYSEQFPAFVVAALGSKEFPFLPDLLNLEWQKILCRQHDTPAPFDFAKLAGLSEDQLAESKMRLNPSWVMLESAWNMTDLLGADFTQQTVGAMAPWVLFQGRQSFTVTQLSRLEKLILELFSQNLSIEAVSASLIEQQAEEEAASECVSAWVQSGLFIGVKSGS